MQAETEIISYELEYYDRLISLNEEFLDRFDTARYFSYRFIENPHKENSRIVLAVEDNRILGQVLMVGNEYFEKGVRHCGVWGMDLIVRPESRGKKLGLKITEESLATNGFWGFGVTPASRKLHQKMGFRFVGKFQKYLMLRSILTPFTLLLSKGKVMDAYAFPDQIVTERLVFHRLQDPSDWDKEFWNSDLTEFSRSREFIKWRYFSGIGEYAVYSSQYLDRPLYYVLKTIAWKNHLLLVIMDYRCRLSDPAELGILISSWKEALRSGPFKGLITGSSAEVINTGLHRSGFLRLGDPSDILTNMERNRQSSDPSHKVFVTMADSDFEFAYRESGHLDRRIIKALWRKLIGKRE